MTDLWLSGVFFQALNSLNSPRLPSRLGRGRPLPIPFLPRRLRRLDLGAFGASVVRPPTQIPGYAYAHPLKMFSEVASRPSSSGVPSHDFYRNFYSARAVTVVIFGHFNRSFLLYFTSVKPSAPCPQPPCNEMSVTSAFQSPLLLLLENFGPRLSRQSYASA